MELSNTNILTRADPGFEAGAQTAGSTVLLKFRLSDRWAAFRQEDVDRLVPMAELACPPGLPSVLEGVLNLAGVAIPVLRLDRLFHLPAQRISLYSMLVILKTRRQANIAILVDRASEVVRLRDSALLPVSHEDSFNGCAEGAVNAGDEMLHVLSPARLLVAKERAALEEFQMMAQQRLEEWGTRQA